MHGLKKPIILIMVYRRYNQLSENLEVINNLARKELGDVPIIIIWSDPKFTHLWVFENLQYDILLCRHIDKNEPKNISGYCSRHIQFGLNFIYDNFGEDYYTIVHCADICPKPGIYNTIHRKMNRGKDAYLVILPNTAVHKNIYHTNFFSVSMNRDYWPPLINHEDSDILEHKWGKLLSKRNLKNFVRVGNGNNNKVFNHIHKEINNYDKPVVKQKCFSLFIRGKTSWLKLMLSLILGKKL